LFFLLATSDDRHYRNQGQTQHQQDLFPDMTFQQPNPFTINVPDSLLKLTKEKLQEARFPDELENVGWEGAPPPIPILLIFKRHTSQ